MEKQSEYSRKEGAAGQAQGWMRRGMSWKTNLMVFMALAGFAFFINRNMKLDALYMDDLYQWYCYFESSFVEGVFTISSTRFRALYNLVSWVQMMLFGTHIHWYVPFNIILNTGIAYTIYWMSRKLSRSIYVGVLCGILFLASRMSYYQIGQILGLMESMAMWMALAILWLLYGYLNEKDGGDQRRIYLASLLYVGVCFVHERYMVLLPLFILVLLFKKAKSWKLWAAPLSGFAFVQAMRLIFIGTVSPAGTGGTDVVETLSVGSVIHFALSQVAYIFGINAGPEHLNGQNFREAPIWVILLIGIADLMILLLVLAFCIRLVQKGKQCVRPLQTAVLFVMFIGACIACSSVTIRVEMRWVYVSFAAALLFMSWMYGTLISGVAETGRWVQGVPFLAVITVYVVLMLPVEVYYRGLYPNLYYWADQEHYNSLAEETYGQYGDAIFDKTIYIIGDKFEMSEFTEEYFFKVFDRQRREEPVKIVHIDDVRDIGLVTDDMLVIQEDPEHNRYQDVTHVVKTMKCRPIYGFYDDGWVDERAEVQVMAGSTGVIDLHFDYPLDVTEDQWLTVYVNGEAYEYVHFDVKWKDVTIEVDPYEPVLLRFETNFCIPDALEKRGATRLAVFLRIEAD